jgi:hypothetical protein
MLPTKEELIQIIIEIYGCPKSIEFVKKCKDIDEVIEKAQTSYWVELLKHRPEFADYCNWSKLDGYNFTILLSSQPQLEKYCDWSKLNGDDFSYLLSYQPQLAKYCDWGLLNEYQFAYLISNQPQLAKFKTQ